LCSVQLRQGASPAAVAASAVHIAISSDLKPTARPQARHVSFSKNSAPPHESQTKVLMCSALALVRFRRRVDAADDAYVLGHVAQRDRALERVRERGDERV